MIITHFGLTCFRIQNSGVAILIDPFDKKTGLDLPRMQNDVILKTQDLPDKFASEKSFTIASPGEYEIKDIFVSGMPSAGDQDNGVIYLIQTEGITLAHLGLTKNTKFTEAQKEMLEGVDILMIPVGGGESLTPKQAAEVVNELEPRVVIPMYYHLPKLKIKLESIDTFKKEVGAKSEKVDKFKINKKDLPQDETKLVIIEPS